ncbi:MAG: alpha/beta fold hydrolase, partial [Colwellia sp.]|nr:alpha/beta fold hydrolase [Colwellia sp.]
MINKLSLVLTIILILSSKYAFSTELNMGERIQINSEHLNEVREIQVLLPEGYHSNSNATYPVIYLLDGDYNIHGVSGMLDLLSNKGQLIPDVILVGIADKGTDKYRQYMTPKDSTAPFKKDAKGNAEQFLTFLEKEVKPYLSERYRVAKNTTIVGHSMGGLFVLNALLTSPNAFDNYVAISPSIWLSDHALTKKAKAILEKSDHEQVSLYLSLADETRMGVYGFMHLLDEIEPKNINWHFTHYPDENHNSVGIISLRDNLKNIFDG